MGRSKAPCNRLRGEAGLEIAGFQGEEDDSGRIVEAVIKV